MFLSPIPLKRERFAQLAALANELKQARGITASNEEVLAIFVEEAIERACEPAACRKDGAPKKERGAFDPDAWESYPATAEQQSAEQARELENEVKALRLETENQKERIEDLEGQLETKAKDAKDSDERADEAEGKLETLEGELDELKEAASADLRALARWVFELGGTLPDVLMVATTDEGRAAVQAAYCEAIPSMPQECFAFKTTNQTKGD